MAAPDLMRRSEIDGQQFAVQEAAAAGLRSMERLVFTLSSPSHKQEDCREIADLTVTKFRNVISLLNRTGHARFRRSPSSSSTPPDLNFSPGSSPVAAQPLQALKPSFLSLDFGKQLAKETFSLPAPISSANSSFISSITGDGSVSNGKQGSSIHVRSALKPPLSSSYKRKCPSHSSSGRCHCAKKRKSEMKNVIEVPAISSKIADIPPDEYSWRKYGQKPIKGSPFPRGYYKCSTMRGCPARKHVERDPNDSSMLIVTYMDEHRHNQLALAQPVLESS